MVPVVWPLGSPTIAVPSPIKAIGVHPYMEERIKDVITSKLPIWKLSEVGSNPA
jgi:hypothetical protein